MGNFTREDDDFHDDFASECKFPYLPVFFRLGFGGLLGMSSIPEAICEFLYRDRFLFE